MKFYNWLNEDKNDNAYNTLIKIAKKHNNFKDFYNEIHPIEDEMFLNDEQKEEWFNNYKNLPDEVIYYIHSFFPTESIIGKGIMKDIVLTKIRDFANDNLEDLKDIRSVGINVSGSDFFGTSTFYKAGKKFFENLVKQGFLKPVKIDKIKGGRALNLFKITSKTKKYKTKYDLEKIFKEANK